MVWDFGTSSDYPILRVDFDGSGTPSWQEFGTQYGSGTPYTPDPTLMPLLSSFRAPAVRIYPMPVADMLHVHSSAAGRLLIYDLTGTLLKTYALSAGVNFLSFSEYKRGVYALHVLLLGKERFHRIVKE